MAGAWPWVALRLLPVLGPRVLDRAQGPLSCRPARDHRRGLDMAASEAGIPGPVSEQPPCCSTASAAAQALPAEQARPVALPGPPHTCACAQQMEGLRADLQAVRQELVAVTRTLQAGPARRAPVEWTLAEPCAPPQVVLNSLADASADVAARPQASSGVLAPGAGAAATPPGPATPSREPAQQPAAEALQAMLAAILTTNFCGQPKQPLTVRPRVSWCGLDGSALTPPCLRRSSRRSATRLAGASPGTRARPALSPKAHPPVWWRTWTCSAHKTAQLSQSGGQTCPQQCRWPCATACIQTKTARLSTLPGRMRRAACCLSSSHPTGRRDCQLHQPWRRCVQSLRLLNCCARPCLGSPCSAPPPLCWMRML